MSDGKTSERDPTANGRAESEEEVRCGEAIGWSFTESGQLERQWANGLLWRREQRETRKCCLRRSDPLGGLLKVQRLSVCGAIG